MANNNSYAAMQERMRAQLESIFTTSLHNGALVTAYKTLGDLMKYGLIDQKDIRLDKKYKGFKMLENPPKLEWDYRNGRFIPMSLYFNCPRRLKFTATAHRHIGKRVEGAYSGEVIVEERTMPVCINLCTTTSTVRNAIEGLTARYKELTKRNLDTSIIEQELMSGETKIYTVEVSEQVPITFRKLGYALVSVTEKGLRILVALSHKALKSDWFEMDTAYLAVGRLLKESLATQNPNIDAKLIYSTSVSDFKAIKVEQADITKLRLENLKTIEDNRANSEVIPLKSKGRQRKDDKSSNPDEQQAKLKDSINTETVKN